MSMFDLLLTTGVKGIDVPDSGIGPTTIVSGNRELGYFGSFPLDQYDLYNKVLALVVDKEGFKEFRAEQDNEWLKFSIGGKSVYTTRRPIGIGLSHEELSRSGMVFGADTFVSGVSARQDAKLSARDSTTEYTLISRLVKTYDGMGASTTHSVFPAYSTPEALNAESNVIMNALAAPKSNEASNAAIPALGWNAVSAPIAYFDSVIESRSALSQEILLGRNRVNMVSVKASSGESTVPIEIDARVSLVAYRPWLDLQELGAVPIGDLRVTEFSTDIPRAVVINSSDDPNKNPLLPAILIKTNQDYIGPHSKNAPIYTSALMNTNQQYVGPFISLP